MSEILTLGRLLDSLNQLAAHIDRNTPVRINGEYVAQYTLQMQNPLRTAPNRAGIIQMSYDPERKQVIDIAVNGRDAPKLEITHFRDLPPFEEQPQT